MAAWTTTEWVIVILAFLAGLFVGAMFCTGRKWKRRYKDEVKAREEDRKHREEIERERKHAEAQRIADHARDDTPPPAKR